MAANLVLRVVGANAVNSIHTSTVLSITSLLAQEIKENEKISSIEESEISDQDKQSLIEDLYYLTLHPANINQADENTLHIIGLSTFQILCLKQYIKETHPLLSLYELPLINGFTQQDINRLMPYLCAKPLDYQPSLRLDSISRHSVSDLRLQAGKTIEKSKGFLRDDGKGYIGNNFSTNIRYNFKYYDRLTFSFLADNDEGEPFFNHKQTKGYDFLSANITLRHISIIEQLTVGDYRLGFAEGLTMNQSLNFGYFSNDAKAKHNYQGIKPNTSMYETNFMRGVATKINVSNFSLYLFTSYKSIDYSGSILESGLHRTQTELSKKDSNTEGVMGARLQWQKRGFEIGAMVFHYQYHYPITHQNLSYMKNYFTGKENNIYSVNFCIPVFKRINSFTEIAMSQNRGKAFLTGMEYEIAYQTNITINYRFYEPTYQNYFASAMGVQSSSANEKGIYVAFAQRVNDKFHYFVAADYFVFPNESYRASKSVKGEKIRLEINYLPKENHILNLFARLNNRPYNYKHTDKLVYPEDNILAQLQLRYSYNVTQNFLLKTRLGFSATKSYDQDTAKGCFIAEDVIFKMVKGRLNVNFRYALFNTDNYDNEFSIYEYGLPLTYMSSHLYDKGQRLYLILRYDFKKNLYLAAKYSITYYFAKNTIHSGNDEIKSKREENLALQFYVLF